MMISTRSVACVWGLNLDNLREFEPVLFDDHDTIISEFSINYEMTTPKSCHDVTTLMET